MDAESVPCLLVKTVYHRNMSPKHLGNSPEILLVSSVVFNM